jgi:hypothetical protein
MGQSSRPPTKEAETTKMSTTMTTTRRTMNRPRTGGFQDQARLGLFVSPLGAFRASGTCGFREGGPQAHSVPNPPLMA